MIIPHAYFETVTEISAEYLARNGIDGLLLDIDGTLKDHDATEVPAVVTAWVSELRTSGVAICLFSNGRPQRVGPIGEALGLPTVVKAMKPFPVRCGPALRLLNLPRNRVMLVGDQMYADVLAGRLYGLTTALVRPTSYAEPWFTRLKRPLERPLLPWIRSHRSVPKDTPPGPTPSEAAAS